MIPAHLRERIERLGRETVELVDYDQSWPHRFLAERSRLVTRFPELVRRVEHFGSTAVPGLVAKPIVDMLVETTNLDEVKAQIVPVLEREAVSANRTLIRSASRERTSIRCVCRPN